MEKKSRQVDPIVFVWGKLWTKGLKLLNLVKEKVLGVKVENK